VTYYNEQETEGRHTFRKPLGRPRSNVRGKLPDWQLEHKMRNPGSGATADDLHDGVRGRISPSQPPAEGFYDGYSGVEVCPAHWTKQRYQGRQYRYGRARVRQKGNCYVSAAEPLGHDSRSDDRRGQQQRPEALPGQAA